MPLSDNLVAYYSLENVNDSVGGLTLTNNSTVTFVSGKVANAANFVSASSQYLSRADNATFDMGDIDFTVVCWAYLATKPASSMQLVTKNNATGNQRGYQLAWSNATDRFIFFVSSDGTSANQVSVSANNFGAPSTVTYYFVACRYDAATDTMSISVNAGTPNTATLAGGAFANTAQFQIGANVGATFWNGRIDEVGIWKRLLSDAEITDLYNAGSGRDYAYISTAGAAENSNMQGIQIGGQLGMAQMRTGGARMIHLN